MFFLIDEFDELMSSFYFYKSFLISFKRIFYKNDHEKIQLVGDNIQILDVGSKLFFSKKVLDQTISLQFRKNLVNIQMVSYKPNKETTCSIFFDNIDIIFCADLSCRIQVAKIESSSCSSLILQIFKILDVESEHSDFLKKFMFKPFYLFLHSNTSKVLGEIERGLLKKSYFSLK